MAFGHATRTTFNFPKKIAAEILSTARGFDDDYNFSTKPKHNPMS
ncbi:hypothetical protein [Moorena sp. SIO4G3]|nr:hypothetical protein [Moorena sp. SIO4G3]